MGATQTSHQAPTKKETYELMIFPSKAVFDSGEPISGQIILNLQEPLLETGILVASLKGKESFYFTPISKSKQALYNENLFLNERLGVFQFNNNIIPAGVHAFPFQFEAA